MLVRPIPTWNYWFGLNKYHFTRYVPILVTSLSLYYWPNSWRHIIWPLGIGYTRILPQFLQQYKLNKVQNQLLRDHPLIPGNGAKIEPAALYGKHSLHCLNHFVKCLSGFMWTLSTRFVAWLDRKGKRGHTINCWRSIRNDSWSVLGIVSIYIKCMLCWQHCTFLLESYAFNINTIS